MVWKPAATRRERNLSLTSNDLAEAERRMAPLARGADGLFPADGVFEGGGVLGTAFLGAARCCADLGLRWNGLAGTSAGAITAALLAADFTLDDLERELGGLDYTRFLGEKTSRLVHRANPSSELERPLRLIANLTLAGVEGKYTTRPFYDWLDGLLTAAGRTTFGDIRAKGGAGRELKVVISDLTRGQMRVLPDDLHAAAVADPPGNLAPLGPGQAAFKVAEAVRLSMSIPLFFAPGRLNGDVIVDGGILSNFPLWIFDDVNPTVPPAWPTFGFRLLDGRQGEPQEVAGATGVLTAMVRTMMVASDRHYVAMKGRGRVIDIDLGGLPVTATQFDLADDLKEELYARGYTATRDFFVNRWDWKKHLELRGPAAPTK